MKLRLVTASLFSLLAAVGAQAQDQPAGQPPATSAQAPAAQTAPAAPSATDQPAPALVPPPLPDTATLAGMSAVDLARGYLAAQAALPLAHQAAAAQGVLSLGIDGQPYTVSSGNAGQFITFLQARVDAFTKAITKRGALNLDGQYALAAGPGCMGEKFDPRVLFSPGKAADGSLLPAKAVQIITSGIDTNMLITLSQNRQVIGVVLTGTAVDDTVIFADVLSMGFSLYGSIGPNTIALRFDPEEVKSALGADVGTDADWKRLAACVFTLTKK
jgi:hypothetical protein